MTFKLLAVGLVAAVLISACGRSASTPPSTLSAPTTTAPHSTTIPASSSDGLTGFGATEAEWDNHHNADTTKAPGSAFGPIVTTSDGEQGDEYADVAYGGGRVTGYNLQLPDGTSLTAAEAIVAEQLPSDAKLTGTYHSTFPDGGTCLYLNYTSSILKRLLAAPQIGDSQGIVGVELWTLTAAGDQFNSQDVNNGSLGLLANTTSTGC